MNSSAGQLINLGINGKMGADGQDAGLPRSTSG